jgi:membrane-bound metal-dependent hydrolase YbcI (DUF457 family)
MLGYMAGALLPDIDSPHSPFGKHFYVDVPHRTWTHSFWFVLLFAISSYWFRPLIWLALGTFFHIFWDSFSVSGIHWFYPWHKDKGHLLQLYRTGETSEKVVMILGVAFAVLLSGFTVWQMTRSQVDVWMRLS